MKKFCLILILAGLSLASCKKEAKIAPGLFGKWELRSQGGGFTGASTTYKAGNGNILQFNSESTYKKYNKGELIGQGAFHIGKVAPYGDLSTAIYFDNSQYGDYFTINGTHITLGTVANDGTATDYQNLHQNYKGCGC